MAILPKVKLKAIVSFPAAILDGIGIDVARSNGTYKFDLAFDDFAPPAGGVADPTHQNALLWNNTTNQYTLVPISILAAGGGVPEAPIDGSLYGRKNASWSVVPVGGGTPSNSDPQMDGVAAPGVQTTYARGDHVHPSDTAKADKTYVDAQDTALSTAISASIVLPAAATPLMDGTAAVGAATKYAREDHAHPSDTSRQPINGDLTAIGALSGTGIARRTSLAPIWSVGDLVANTELASMAAFSFKGNNNSGPTTPADVTIPGLTTKASPAGTDYLIVSDTSASGAWKKVAIATLPGSSGGIPEAPNDGLQYGRQSQGWTQIAGGGGATPSNTFPAMDGTANAGTSLLYSRGDHVHPTDTSRQAADAELTAIAGLVSAADKLPYFIGSGTASLATFTSYARTLVAAIDAPTARTTLGLSTAATATPSALTKTDDANVTLALGGTPTTALLQATSITVGWSGTLSAARGGLGVNASAASGVALWASGVPTFTATTGTGNLVRANSAALTGGPTAPTPLLGDASTLIATTNFVATAVATVAVLPASATPLAGVGAGTVGTSLKYAREDHVHPAGVAGSGNVVGPASAVDSNLAAFDTTTGKLIKDSGVALAAAAGAVRYDVPQTLTANQQAQVRSNIGSFIPNVLINGDFRIQQDATYVSGAVLAAGAYGHDQWKAGASGGDYFFTQLKSSTQITIASGKSLIQPIEDVRVVGGSYVLTWTGTAQARAGVNTLTPSGAYATSPLLITGQTAATVMSIEFNAGTLGTVKLEVGAVATPFVMTDYSSELLVCQRYFRMWGNGCKGIWPTTAVARISEQLPVPMRATPTATLTTTSPQVEWWNLANFTGSGSVITNPPTAPTFMDVSITGFTATGITAGASIAFMKGDYIKASARL